jgi:aromatic ring hydroxylase
MSHESDMGAAHRPRLRSAAEYRESLRDGRRVSYRGEPVGDVTTHPVFSLAVDHAALDFDMAHDARYRDVAVGPDGGSRYFHGRASARICLRAAR